MLKIDQKIVGYELVTDTPEAATAHESEQTSFLEAPTSAEIAPAAAAEPPVRPDPSHLEHMSELVERQEELFGCTYKIKPSTLDHALYVTINDIVLNEGTPHEVRRPFEIFISSKNMEQFEWIVALTRLASAVFRKGGNLEFMVEELKSVYAPQGGYWKPGTGQYMNSVVAEIGWILERHMQKIGLIAPTRPDAHMQKLIDEKRRQSSTGTEAFAESAQLCGKCHDKAVMMLDGCLTCLSCGDSKCQ